VTIAYNHAMSCTRLFTMIFGLGLMLAAGLCVWGCDSPGGDRVEMGSSYPLDRARAIVRRAEAGDAGAVDLLIGLLDDTNRGVRMYAILALQRLCGEDYGYRYYAPETERAAAIARWHEARQRGEVAVRTSPRPTGSNAVGASAAQGSEETSP
jgi:hypothetical protein